MRFQRDDHEYRWKFDYLTGELHRFVAYREEHAPHITLDDQKTPHQAAPEVVRRLILPSRVLHEKLLQRRQEKMDRDEACHDAALELVCASRGYAESLDHDHLGTSDDGDQTVYLNRTIVAGVYLRTRVSSWSLNCHVHHLDIPIGLMKRIMATFADYLDERSKL